MLIYVLCWKRVDARNYSEVFLCALLRMVVTIDAHSSDGTATMEKPAFYIPRTARTK